ncbi:Uncharacterised protein [Mycobacteroides abscessus subsp. massiliense]|uniref:hypothetical protein n=1 Tax=Mycobacteroides abscessus TaxID=36809 RepID=UPI0009A73D84|nr:hypothetical protein [Mycobacteroides abscessus]MDO3055627.1 hypothetical protein [Mycobacteroides abscessus subsp. massiliense]SLC38021.1 Uncharacterised protein [Mycobacteroides abscessus subsp. massiliense]SLH30460.1 Uncharacterised protein [Mycobacteroides abscessus subsp. massiliense]SLI03496.1 Uncharacterised protein [Mycobacteroides abscessus subsp. massiliense]
MNWNRWAKVFWTVMLAIAVGVSVKGNVHHAAAVAPDSYRFLAELVAGGLPVALFLMIEGIAIGELGGAHGKVKRTGLVLTAALGMIVLAVSYTALLSIVNHANLTGIVWLNRGLAVVPDLLMIASTLYLMSLRGVGVKVEKSSSTGRWSRLAEAATRRLETKLEVPETPQVDTLVEVHGGPVEDFAEPMPPAMETFTEPLPPSPEPSTKPAMEAPPTSTKVSMKSSTKPLDDELEPFMEAAMAMEEDGLVRGKSAADYAKLIDAIEQRWSPNRVKSELSYSPSTTEKVRAAWQDWQQQRDAERQQDWKLSAVG